eukprot:JP446412.1.p1 GENE.JP446412.1~~JP446412.1.p1  ORF type:complete len:280 (-),score=58.01 JP446412.1:248-1087(-)
MTDTLRNAEGLALFKNSWIPESAPKGVYIFVHGFGEHCMRPGWVSLAEALNKEGFAVFALDHQGHGKSEGERANIRSFQGYIDGVMLLVAHAKTLYPDLPYYIYGHSMGSIITISSVLQHPEHFKGMVLSGTALFVDPELVTPFKKFLARTLSFVAPGLQLDKLDTADLSRNEEAVKRYIEDPLVYHGGVKVGWGSEYLKVLEILTLEVRSIELPFLLFHGEADKLCNVKGAHHVHDNAKSADKTLKVIPGAKHELLEDPDKDTVFTEFLSWSVAHLPA